MVPSTRHRSGLFEHTYNAAATLLDNYFPQFAGYPQDIVWVDQRVRSIFEVLNLPIEDSIRLQSW